jgi:hypothetical protein
MVTVVNVCSLAMTNMGMVCIAWKVLPELLVVGGAWHPIGAEMNYRTANCRVDPQCLEGKHGHKIHMTAHGRVLL